ncbi:RNA exonuclease 4-like isoform X2 [Tachypleus tridentatus]|uniref:RNA exonuclease 4-like isoform X2 n=1 Tax=Tachypleus tridentatus TaxID=6853 RepID=UPI003FD31E62
MLHIKVKCKNHKSKNIVQTKRKENNLLKKSAACRYMQKKKVSQQQDQNKLLSHSKTCSVFPKKSIYTVSANWKQLAETLRITEKKEKLGEKERKQNNTRKNDSTVKPLSNTPPDVWFDDVDKDLLDLPMAVASLVESGHSEYLVKEGSFSGLTKVIAMDCEMVGVGDSGKDSELARVSIVNLTGHCIYDKFVKPKERVTDYRTHVSGVRPADLEAGEEFSLVQKEVYDILKGRILVGHAVHHDLKVLFLDHPRNKIRDTAYYQPFKKMYNGKTPSLKKLAECLLGVKVQQGEHSSVQDAQAAMRLYTMYRSDWEAAVHKLAQRRRNQLKKPK